MTPHEFMPAIAAICTAIAAGVGTTAWLVHATPHGARVTLWDYAGACDREHVVERHGNVGDHDLPGGLREGLARPATSAGDGAVGINVFDRDRLHRIDLDGMRRRKLAPHLPAYPEQQYAAGEQQADDLQQLRRHQREHDAQAGRRGDADQDCLRALMGGQAGGGKADDDGIVAGQHQVDHQHLEESPQHDRIADV